jgi:hypothetical protein
MFYTEKAEQAEPGGLEACGTLLRVERHRTQSMDQPGFFEHRRTRDESLKVWDSVPSVRV